MTVEDPRVGDVVQYRGWYEMPIYWGPKFWKQYLFPCIHEQAEMVHSAGKLFSYLLPAGQGAYANDLKDLGLDVIQGLDPRMLYAGDLRSLFDKLGEDMSFWGGVNAEVTLTSCDARQIEDEVRQAIEILGRNHGLILSALTWPTTPQEGILAMIEAWRKYCDGGRR